MPTLQPKRKEFTTMTNYLDCKNLLEYTKAASGKHIRITMSLSLRMEVLFTNARIRRVQIVFVNTWLVRIISKLYLHQRRMTKECILAGIA
jgi:hypothetical protein